MNHGGIMLLPTPGRSTHALGMPRQQGQRVPVEGSVAKGCPTHVGQLAQGSRCKAETGLATIPMVAHGIPQWPGAAERLPLPTPASSSSSSSTPGSSVGTSSRFSLGADPVTETGVKTPAGTQPVGTARARTQPADGHPAAPLAPAPPAPGTHGSVQGSPPGLRVPVVALWLQEGY